MIPVNYVAIGVASVVSMIVGSLWYSPFLFGASWMHLRGIDPKKQGDTAFPVKDLLIELLITLVTVYVLDILVIVFGAVSLRATVQLSLLVWVGFYLSALISQTVWEKRPFGLLAINASLRLVIVVIVTAILGAWNS